MGPFDYLFSFYGLLLGIAVANVAIGFADMWRDCERIRVGTCPPLVASSVLLGGMNVWLQMWYTRPYVSVDGLQMLTAAAVSLPYVFVSRAIFPGREDDQERSLEDHYLRHRELILFLLAVPMIFSIGSHILLDRVRYDTIELAWVVSRIILPLAMIPFASRWVQRSGLVGLNMLQLIGLVEGLFR
ncbi:hypothetical protein GCM10022276_02490 [Sphingomonas limnosediminicola]|jgi:hypothetical protein|uniref:Uncharacterized protein n=1 Tax=Sphingomonas limnosediminicola TaxID=940133 RepID=A0ABP7KTH5_9SPHN